jgi:hypothetical protein
VDPYGNICREYDDDYGEETKRARFDDDTTIRSSLSRGYSSSAVEMDMTSDDGELVGHGMDHVVSNVHNDEQVPPEANNTVTAEEENLEIAESSLQSQEEEKEEEIMESVTAPDAHDAPSGIDAAANSVDVMSENHQDNPFLYNMSNLTPELPSFASRSVGEIRQLASSLNVDISGCLEKREMVDLVMKAIVKNARSQSS